MKLAMKPTEFGEITPNNGHYAVQGHSKSPILVTLNDLERRNGRVVCVISPNSVALVPLESSYTTSY